MNRLHDEWPYFIAAVMFYTRIPTPQGVPHSDQILNRSRKYFPAIGVLIGSIAVASYALANMVFSDALSVALSMLVTIAMTGAFHEDGFADSCDGLGGGWTSEQVLTIMKDSRLGTYGAIGLVLILAIKFLTLLELTQLSAVGFAAIYISAHTLSRQVSSSMIERFDYVQDIDASKVKPITNRHLSRNDRLISGAITTLSILPLLFIAPIAVCLGLISVVVVSAIFMRYCHRRIGGYTGDILGAVQQISEVIFYLTVLALLR